MSKLATNRLPKSNGTATPPPAAPSLAEQLAADEAARVARCEALLEAAFRETRCSLDVSAILSARGFQPQIRVVALRPA